MFRRIKFIADAGQVARSLGFTGLAIAVAVYAIVTRVHSLSSAVLGALVLCLVIGAFFQVSQAVRKLGHERGQALDQAQQAERHYFQVISRVCQAIESRHQHIRGRSQRVGRLAARIGGKLGLPEATCQMLELVGQVHDIGLLVVPDRILDKPGALAGEEFRTIQEHPEASYRILQPLTFLAEILPAVRYHHERMNGTGYPAGLAGEAIPLTARVLAVAEAYDSMTHDRPHAPALAPAQAVGELRRCSPAGYDPQCVEAMEALLYLPPAEQPQARLAECSR